MNKPIPWRSLPGFYRPGESNLKSIQTLLSDFLRDRHSPSLLQNYYDNEHPNCTNFGWSDAAPLEKEIISQQDRSAEGMR